jgi:C_GCAxxG_C_C family probable redox protein
MTRSRADEAEALFREGFSCSQAVLAVFAGDFGLDRDIAIKIAQGFGGGISLTDDICGALSGAVMVIGLRYGRTKAEDIAAKDRTYEAVRKFLLQFKERHNGEMSCTGLVGFNLSDPAQFAAAKEQKVVRERCPSFVRDAVELVEKLLYPVP